MVIFFINQPQLTDISNKLLIFKNSVSMSSLFFQGENISNYLRLNKVGYFSPMLVPFFMGGIYYSIKDKHEISKFFKILFIGLIFFILFPSTHFIFIGLGLLFVIQLLIIQGINRLPSNILFSSLFFIGYLFFSFFFLEIYMRHYQAKNSTERNLAEIRLVDKLINLKNKRIYIKEDGVIKNIISHYSYKYSFSPIIFINSQPINLWINVIDECFGQNVVCVLDKSLIDTFRLNPDDSKFQYILNSDGSKAFYIISGSKKIL